jgi:hypothetical protein
VDLLTAGFRAADVRVLGINGGPLALLEYQFALALGASVAVVQGSGRAIAALVEDADWKNEPRLRVIPPTDVLALRAFANPGRPHLFGDDPARLDAVASEIHEYYRIHFPRTDLANEPWPKLGLPFKASNLDQARCIGDMLWLAGFEIRRVEGQPTLIEFEAPEVEVLSALEHQRWCDERSCDGWQFGPKRDPVKKISPFLVSYAELPEDQKEKDRAMVRLWPDFLAAASFDIVRKGESK